MLARSVWSRCRSGAPRRIGIAGTVLASLLVACAPTTATPPAPVLPGAGAILDAAWVEVRPGTGGYANVDLAEPPSLYDTAWAVRLATLLNTPTARLDRPRCVEWLRAQIAASEPVDQLDELESLALATQALVDLGAPPPVDAVTARLDRLRAGGQYRSRPAEPPTWNATAAAVVTLKAMGAAIPPPVAEEIRTALRNQTATGTVETWRDLDQAVWQAASAGLPAHERLPYRGLLGGKLGRLATTLARGHSPVEQLALGASATRIAVDNALPAPPFHMPDLRDLIDPGGLLRIGDNPDPHLTVDAVTLGWTPPGTLAGTLGAAARPTGWRLTRPAPDPLTTVRALIVATPDPARLAAIRHYADEQTIALSTARPAEAYAALLLARRVGSPRFEAAARAVARHLPGTTSPEHVLWQLRLARLLDMPVWPTLADRLRGLAARPTPTIRDAVTLHEAGAYTQDRSLSERARSIAAALCANALCRPAADPRAPADLESTAAGLSILDSPPDLRERARTAFVNTAGAWCSPPSTTTPNRQDVHCLYWAFMLTHPGSAT